LSSLLLDLVVVVDVVVSSSLEPELEPPELEPLELEPLELEPLELEPLELEPLELEPLELEPPELEPLESEPPELPPPLLPPPELPPLLLPEARALLTCRMAGATKAPTAPRPRSDSSLRRSLFMFTVSVMSYSLVCRRPELFIIPRND
jgi:hypothetical protein